MPICHTPPSLARPARALIGLGAWCLLVGAASAQQPASPQPTSPQPSAQAPKSRQPSAPTSASPQPGAVDYQLSSEVAGYGDTDSVFVLTPSLALAARAPASGWGATASYLVDVVSAASVDIVSTASARWTEVRQAGALSADYKPGAMGATLGGSVSREPDYVSWYLGGAFRMETMDKRFTPLIGYSYSRDTAGRTGTPFDVYALRLQRHSLQLGAEIIVNPATRVSLAAEAVLEAGRQEKPYRYLPVFAADVVGSVPRAAAVDVVNSLRLPGRMAERTPDTRQRYSVTSEISWRQSGGDELSATLRVAERLYTDSWGLLASTTDARFIMGLGGGFRLWPHLRAHAQSGVSFWERAYVAQPGSGEIRFPSLRTGDRELGPLFTGSFGFGAQYATQPGINSSWLFTALADVGRTSYLDALFTDQRTSLFVSLMAGHSL